MDDQTPRIMADTARIMANIGLIDYRDVSGEIWPGDLSNTDTDENKREDYHNEQN